MQGSEVHNMMNLIIVWSLLEQNNPFLFFPGARFYSTKDSYCSRKQSDGKLKKKKKKTRAKALDLLEFMHLGSVLQFTVSPLPSGRQTLFFSFTLTSCLADSDSVTQKHYKERTLVCFPL